MKFDPNKHNRRSIRLKDYNYAKAGAYFITICTQNRACLFGEILNGLLRLNDAGQMIQSAWDELPQNYTGVDIDACIVMPNHIHGIIVLSSVGAGPRAYPNNGQPQGVALTMSLPDVVHRFKSLTTARFRHGVVEYGWPPFFRKLWQRNYYEHVIRNQNEWNRIQEYIATNPAHWAEDVNNPARGRRSVG